MSINRVALSIDQVKFLDDLYYSKGMIYGRDKLYKYISNNYPDQKISRRQIARFLSNQETSQLYQQTRKTVDIKKTVLSKPKSQIGIDLIDMSNKEYKGYKWILTCYDLFSKKGYAVPLKNKIDTTVAKAMENLIMTEMKDVKSVRSDNGSEFISKEFKDLLAKYNIKHVFSKPSKPQSNGGVERFNKTLKRYLLMAMYMNDSYDWVKYVPEFVQTFNDTINRVTQETPITLNESTNSAQLKQTKDKIIKSSKTKNNNNGQKFNIGDKVRRKLEPDERTNGQNWSTDIFNIYRVSKPRSNSVNDYTYFIKDNKDKYTIKYYTNDLLKIENVQNEISKKKKDKFTISKLIKPVFKDKEPAYFVRWKYYRAGDDTIEPRSKLLEDVPKLVHKFEKDHAVKWYDTAVHFNDKL